VRAHLCFWITAAAGLVLDLGSKEWAFHTLRQDGERALIPHVLELYTTFNSGALFGLAQGKTLLFLLASALALALVLWMFAQSSARRWALHVALGAILAGALGNMYDRAFVKLTMHPLGQKIRYWERGPGDATGLMLYEYPRAAGGRTLRIPAGRVDQLSPEIGYVRDFIKIPTRWLGGRELWPWVFNVADVLLVCGVGILAIFLWVDRKAHRLAPRSVEAAARRAG